MQTEKKVHQKTGEHSTFRKLLSLATAVSVALTGCAPQVMVLAPVGPVARREANLFWLSLILVCIVVIPVIVLLWYIVHRFKDTAGNNAPYEPEWSESRTLEVIWWGVPILIVAVLGAFTARDTFALTNPPEQSSRPVTIEVTSLDWKWLFQYPGQNVATVNYCEIPTNRPVQFVLTSNAPMNSFWVPHLGGQEYTMAGMAMRLWLQADKPGVYYGHSANYSGKFFAEMKFDVVAVPQTAFDAWVQKVKRTSPALTKAGYQKLVAPSVTPQMSFSSYPPGIFKDIIMAEGGMYMKHDMSILNDIQ